MVKEHPFFSFIEGDTLDSIEQSFLSGDTDVENDPPVIRIRNAIQEIEERRTAKLQHMHVIGNVTYKKPNFASELVHNVRRVNFKWQLGNKIGKKAVSRLFFYHLLFYYLLKINCYFYLCF